MSIASGIVLLLVTAAVADEPAIERLGEEASRALVRFYDYEPSIPLEARVVEKAEHDDMLREKIVFRGAQGFLVPGYLQLPAGVKGPLPCVLLLHGWSGSKQNWWEDGGYIKGGDARRALLKAGFAVFVLDAQCHGDRIAQNEFAPVNHFVDPKDASPRRGFFTLQDIYIQTTRDYRRAIDYLATREEIDAARIGVLGYSMGGTQTYLLTGVEPRIKAAVSVAAPAEKSKFSPVAPQNFLQAIGDRPLLSIMGRSDELCSEQHAQARHALWADEHHQQVFLDAGHKLPAEYVPHAVAWLKKYL